MFILINLLLFLSKKVDVDIETKIIARRHTFSGYKRRKRIPTTQTSVVTDTSKIF